MLTFFLTASAVVLIPGGLFVGLSASAAGEFRHWVWAGGVLLSALGLADFGLAVWVNSPANKGGKAGGGP